MNRRRPFLLIASAFFVVWAGARPASAGLPAGIDWYRGSVEAAFGAARASGRPLFLYWGAVWCPPCNQIKARVFVDPRFRRALEPFIAVYLDGDTDRAQRWGEKLDATGGRGAGRRAFSGVCSICKG